MKKIWSIFIGLSLFSMGLLAQPLEVISSSGGYFTNGTGSVTFTLGECVISTYSSSSLIITQGFNQTYLFGPVLADELKMEFDIAAFPNPVSTSITLFVKNPRSFYYVLYDISGMMLQRNDIFSEDTKINFEDLPAAVYILRVFKDTQEVTIFKIIKQ